MVMDPCPSQRTRVIVNSMNTTLVSLLCYVHVCCCGSAHGHGCVVDGSTAVTVSLYICVGTGTTRGRLPCTVQPTTVVIMEGSWSISCVCASRTVLWTLKISSVCTRMSPG